MQRTPRDAFSIAAWLQNAVSAAFDALIAGTAPDALKTEVDEISTAEDPDSMSGKAYFTPRKCDRTFTPNTWAL